MDGYYIPGKICSCVECQREAHVTTTLTDTGRRIWLCENHEQQRQNALAIYGNAYLELKLEAEDNVEPAALARGSNPA